MLKKRMEKQSYYAQKEESEESAESTLSEPMQAQKKEFMT
jgi:hypothetical protein